MNIALPTVQTNQPPVPPAAPIQDSKTPLKKTSPAWTDVRVEWLKKLWGDGLSASQIAVEMGDITRNAVIGKVHRLGLGKALTDEQRSHRQGARNRAGRPKRQVIRARKPGQPIEFAAPYIPAEVPPPDLQFLCTLDDLGSNTARSGDSMKCRGPVGEPGTEGFRFCGSPDATMPGPYCDFHKRMFYQPGSALGSRVRPIRVSSGYLDRVRAPSLECAEHTPGTIPVIVE